MEGSTICVRCRPPPLYVKDTLQRVPCLSGKTHSAPVVSWRA